MNNSNDNTKKSGRGFGFDCELLVDAATGIPLVTAFLPRTESDIETLNRWFALEGRRRYRFEGRDKPGKEPRDV